MRCFPSFRARLLFYLQVSRPGFWLTSVWFYLLPVGGREMFGCPSFWLGLIYVTLPMGFILYGWNDLFDQETDHLNPRKGTYLFGANGTKEQLATLPLWMAVSQIPFVVAFTWVAGPKMLTWFILLVAVNALYNHPRFGLKNFPFTDILNQAGYLLVFILSSWINGVPQLSAPVFLFGALFAMHSHVVGQIMDLEADRDAGRRTTAVCIGRQNSKALITAFLIGEACIIWTSFQDIIITGFLLSAALAFLYDFLFGFKDQPYHPALMKFILIAWNLAALASMVWIWSSAALIQ